TTVENNRVVAGNIPHDWSRYKYLSFWAYSAAANKTSVMLVAYSASSAAPDDDYYRYKIVLDWTGWKLFEIPLSGFTVTRNPAGWNKVDFLKFASSGWSQTPFQNTLLYFDAMRLTNSRAGQ
ncbi:MAG TPA: carbohydrate binding domain-containing protein, partial [Anaerolineae bacterium]